MAEGYRDSCLCRVDRLGNDELCTLMADVVKHDGGASQQLLVTVKPLLTAFYEGQVQAGRVRREEVEGLVQKAFMALYQRRASYDSNIPFRAWLIEIARDTLLDYWRSQSGNAVVEPLASVPALNHHEVLRAI
ncbi:sigma factor [Pseudomonas frederiksbergensis]|uniref:sigma factor n=1 Tax=Pseudomonas frederiksbergensis TaxID=104087 RepID=UPI003D1953B8